MLNWITVTPSHEPAFGVRGTVLSRAVVPGTLSRFVVAEVRTHTAQGPDRVYHLEDAATVTDADVAAGKRPRVVGRFDTPEGAVEAAKV